MIGSSPASGFNLFVSFIFANEYENSDFKGWDSDCLYPIRKGSCAYSCVWRIK
jgi:hypothetical protein